MQSPQLHPCLFLAQWQVLAWLVVHPSAWRSYIEHVDPVVAPDFTLLEGWHHQTLKRFFYLAVFIQPLTVGLLVAGVLLLFFRHTDIIFSATFGMVFCLVFNLITSLSISILFALVAGLLGGLFLGIARGFEWSLLPLVGGGFFILGMTSGILATMNPKTLSQRWDWRAGGVIIGLSVSIGMSVMLLAGALFVGELVADYVSTEEVLGIGKEKIISYGSIATMFVVAGFLLFPRWWGKLLALLLGIIVLVLFILVRHFPGENNPDFFREWVMGIVGGFSSALVIVVLFGLPYLLACRRGNVWSGVVAGLLSSSSVFVIYLSNFLESKSLETAQNYPLWLASSVYLWCLLGLLYQRWLPVIWYPLSTAWNLHTQRMQDQFPERSIEYLFKNAAFWDEHQRLPFTSLTYQLATAYEDDSSATQEALRRLSTGYQHKVVQATQIELDLKTLEKCAAVSDIARVNHKLMIYETLTNPIGNRFKKLREVSEDVLKTVKLQNIFQKKINFERIQASLKDWSTGIIGEQVKDGERFHALATQWQIIIDKYVQELLKDQKILNPYTFGTVLTNQHVLFVGRTQVSERLEQLLSAKNCPPLLLYGQRRTGKTSLIYNLISLLPRHFTLLFVDCQGTPQGAENTAQFLYNVSYEINQFHKQHPHLITLPTLSEDSLKTNPFMRFNEWLDEIEAVTGENNLLLVMDEFEALVELFTNGQLQPEAILGMLRHLIQHRQRFRVLIAGSHELHEIPYWSSYLINAQRVDIGQFLEEDEAIKLITLPIADFLLDYTSEAKQQVLFLTRAHPALLQLLCASLVELKNTQPLDKRFLAEKEDVDRAVPNTFLIGHAFFSHINYGQINEVGRAVLQFIAEQGAHFVARQDVLQTQFPHGLAEALELLLKRELIEYTGDGYRFQVELIRQWFAQHKVINEF